ncbi:hypothetical protein J6TS1_03200 [Siminovitchia terrae]|uniref:Uncharacterized protein n=2 Tax=Siminovitchia terrae TaxID=1914933 RepID=A0A429X5I8_SIMTE|nr:hypothetical protein [Siminovitchia terrae]RST58695.1 hypothetical protein D5F11_015755 [Siminovitchia terrae]GIN90030.1 hypothetical protein J22TS1_10810 [Siminovitchia terrae]GIN94450.1 hypothetical protein J6TS1_03200 [Siminovitchia terrae]
MMIVKVKSKEHAFTIPIPYAVLRMGSGILTSNLVQRKVKGWLNKQDRHADGHSSRKHDFDSNSNRFGSDIVLSILENRSTKQAIRQLIRELQHCKGTVLVDVQAQDGTEVLIKL